MSKLVKGVLIVLVLFIVIVVVLPFIIPLSTYIPTIERIASEKLGQPVTVKELHAALLPLPTLTLGEVSVGKNKEITIAKLKTTFDPRTVFKPIKIIKEVEADSINLKGELLGALLASFKSDKDATSVRLLKVRLLNVMLDMPKVRLKKLNGEVHFTPAGEFDQAIIHSVAQDLNVVIKPTEQDFYRVYAVAKNWALPFGPAILFDNLTMRAIIEPQRLNLTEVTGQLYGGTLAGTGQLNWADSWQLKGELRGKRIQLKPVVALLNAGTSVTGALNANTRFAMISQKPENLFSEPRMTMQFDVKNGAIYNINLVDAVKTLSKRGVHGGQTQFDEFSGVLEAANKRYHFKQLKIASGLLKANGDVSIASDKRLNGRMYVQIAGTANMINMPLDISGTLQNPSVWPSTAALTGAAAGTALLGPGVGTALGVKASGVIEKVFNRK